MLEAKTDKEVKKKIKQLNEPGTVVKCLDISGGYFDMEDIGDIPTNLPENLRNANTQTHITVISTTKICVQTNESHNCMLHPEPHGDFRRVVLSWG